MFKPKIVDLCNVRYQVNKAKISNRDVARKRNEG